MASVRNGKVTPAARPRPEPGGSRSDGELVLAARGGDKRAFVEIVARYQAMVCGIALGVLGDFAASEDAGQEAFLTAWRKLDELREPERLRAWLGQIARHAALGLLRRNRGHEPLEAAPVEEDAAPRPDEAAAREDELALVRDCLARLPETYRLPLVLYYREGQSVAAVAEALELGEDAVKQRLARGRELLRDRMCSLIETVLTRTRPTAAFTVAVAVAIGALAAPAAVAGSVFSATSGGAGATTAATAGPASFLAAMSTTKTVLVAAALAAIVCIPAGYEVRASRQRSQETRPAPVTAKGAVPTPARAPDFADSALLAEWRLLHDKYGRGSDAMPRLYSTIAGLKDPFRRRAFHAALLAEWAQVDPRGGLKFMLGKGPDPSQRRQFFEEWLAVDARGAVDAFLAAGPGAGAHQRGRGLFDLFADVLAGPGSAWEQLARDCLPEIARKAPARVADLVARLSKSENPWDRNVRDAFAIVAAGGLEPARRGAEAITGPNRAQALAGVAQVWARTDLHAAIAWAKALPDAAERAEATRAALVGKAALDPAAALELVGTVPPSAKPDDYGSTTGARVLEAAAETGFDAAVAWVVAHPGRLTDRDLYGLSGAVTDRMNADPTGFMDRCVQDGSLAALLPAIGIAILNDHAGQQTVVWDWLKT